MSSEQQAVCRSSGSVDHALPVPIPPAAALIAPFVYDAQPSRVIFGTGTVSQLSSEAERLGLTRLLVVATPGQQADAQRIVVSLGGRVAASFLHAAEHTPVEVTARAMDLVRSVNADGIVAVGGGSATGLAKAIAYRTDLPQIVVPTTYAGSEMTSILGETEAGAKVTRRDPKILPEVVVYDVDLTMSLPPAISSASGMNAIAHAVEALYAPDVNPIIALLAESAIAALAQALPAIARNPLDATARTHALYGAWLCGVCLNSTSMALHHKLCHTLGGAYGLPHADMHAAVLSHVVAYNQRAAPHAMTVLARALGVADPATELFDLAARIGIPMALRDIGMPYEGIDAAADLAMQNVYSNPRALERDAIRDLLAAAWAGKRPGGAAEAGAREQAGRA
jgi:maleylacetate reductase